MNDHKKGLKRLLDEGVNGQIGRLVLTHKDRLLRFGAELVLAICAVKNVEVVILNQGEDTPFEEEPAKDVLEIITVFSARLYDSRSRKNQKLLDGREEGRGGFAHMLIAHKIALDLNNMQATHMARAASTAPTGRWPEWPAVSTEAYKLDARVAQAFRDGAQRHAFTLGLSGHALAGLLGTSAASSGSTTACG